MNHRSMRLSRLFQGLPVQVEGARNLCVTGIASQVDRVMAGNLFVMRRGIRSCSHYLVEAVQTGATALLTDRLHPALTGVTQVVAADVAALEPLIGGRFYGAPDRELHLIGITGTNGKTTTSHLLQHMLHNQSAPCGQIGTSGYLVGERRMPATLTTPDHITLLTLLREMVGCHSRYCVMEVSSHALDQGRVAGLKFGTALLTNLSQDHLDYHGTMEQYRLAKAKLFDMDHCPAQSLVLNAEDRFAQWIAAHSDGDIVTYGRHEQSDLRLLSSKSTVMGSKLAYSFNRQKAFTIDTPLIGHFNALNMSAALLAAYSVGLPFDLIQERAASFQQVPGRLESISNSLGCHLFVDFAHTPAALEQAIQTLRMVAPSGRVLTLFGCGGGRDRVKRAQMGRIAHHLSDAVVLTCDNLRDEPPEQILHEVKEGFCSSKPYLVEPDRSLAIERLLLTASPGDCVLIAGRGAEPVLDIGGGSTVPFDDRQVVAQIAQRLATAQRVGGSL